MPAYLTHIMCRYVPKCAELDEFITKMDGHEVFQNNYFKQAPEVPCYNLCFAFPVIVNKFFEIQI